MRDKIYADKISAASAPPTRPAYRIHKNLAKCKNFVENSPELLYNYDRRLVRRTL